jgi:hypothetical protein
MANAPIAAKSQPRRGVLWDGCGEMKLDDGRGANDAGAVGIAFRNMPPPPATLRSLERIGNVVPKGADEVEPRGAFIASVVDSGPEDDSAVGGELCNAEGTIAIGEVRMGGGPA